jgi:hypothetical protein
MSLGLRDTAARKAAGHRQVADDRQGVGAFFACLNHQFADFLGKFNDR